MDGKIIVPVIDTECGKYYYGGKEITKEEYDRMGMEHFRKYDSAINYANRYGYHSYNSRYVHNIDNHEYTKVNDVYNNIVLDAIIKNGNKEEITEEELLSHLDGNMFILYISIDPKNFHNFEADKEENDEKYYAYYNFGLSESEIQVNKNRDAESEIRFWIDDSRKVHADRSLRGQNKIILERLPNRTFGVELSDGRILWLVNCKMVIDLSDKDYPYYFGIIIEKAEFFENN